ncbi:MAG TPA: amino acid permease [Steroidobacter sp.]
MSAALHPRKAPDSSSVASGASVGPTPTLSIFDATMITVGIVIGAGIFQTPSLVATNAGTPALTITAWALAGVLSFAGALTYAELATTYPSAGGDYTFLTRAYGKNLSFLFAWARSTVICTGSIALLGFILGDYLTRLYPLGPQSSALYAAVAVLVLTVVNLIGLKSSAKVQNTLGVLEIAGVLAVALVGFLLEPAPASEPPAASAATSTGSFGLAMVLVLLTYGGWNEAAYVSAEVRGGPRAVRRSLVMSIAIITIVYLLFVIGVMQGLGFEGLKASEAVGIDIAERMFGSVGGQLIGIIVAISALSSMNSTMLAGARTNYSVARDWPIFGFMGQWQGERSQPAMGFIVQAGISLALIGYGALEKDGFMTMVEFTAPVFWFFFMLGGIALFVLRRKDPGAARPFKVPLYPVIPIGFVLTCAYLLYSSIMYAQSRHATHVAFSVMLSGALVLIGIKLRERSRRRAQPQL